MADMIGDLLAKLSKKTGREWNLLDLMRLAEKLQPGKQGDLDDVFAELGDMGLDMSDTAKEKIRKKLDDGGGLLEDGGLDLGKLMKKTTGKTPGSSAGKTAEKKAKRSKKRKNG